MAEMTEVIRKFLRYVKIDTQSDEMSDTTPSTMKQHDLAKLLAQELEKLGVSEQELGALSSVDRKQEEDGLLDLADYLHIPFFTYGERELVTVRGEFASSAFVEKVVGVDNVCERAAWLGAGEKGEFILKKTAENGMTLAVVRREV